MIIYFDTSSLVRRYHVTEPGATRVRQFCRRGVAEELVILSLTSIEAASAFNRKLQLGQIDSAHRDRMWRLFRVHRATHYRVIQLTDAIERRAQRLLFQHRLRAYDAAQLAGAIGLKRSLPHSTDIRFCTADRGQALAADAEGLTVEFIA